MLRRLALLSPDGRWLAYPWVTVQGKGTSVNVISIDGADDRLLYQATTPIDIRKWTTSGDAVVVREASGTPQHRVILAPFGGGPPRELLRLAPNVDASDLAPDERTMVVTRQNGKEHDIGLIDLATGSEIWTLAEPTNDAQALFTRDGRSLLMATLSRNRPDLWKIDPDQGEPMKLSLEADSIWDLAVSPDGTELLYSSGNPRPDFVLLKGIGEGR